GLRDELGASVREPDPDVSGAGGALQRRECVCADAAAVVREQELPQRLPDLDRVAEIAFAELRLVAAEHADPEQRDAKRRRRRELLDRVLSVLRVDERLDE